MNNFEVMNTSFAIDCDYDIDSKMNDFNIDNPNTPSKNHSNLNPKPAYIGHMSHNAAKVTPQRSGSLGC